MQEFDYFHSINMVRQIQKTKKQKKKQKTKNKNAIKALLVRTKSRYECKTRHTCFLERK